MIKENRKERAPMGRWRKLRRAAFAAGVAVTAVVGTTTPASAQTENWGTVLTGAHCTQAHAWSIRARGITGIADISLFPAHYPATADMPNTNGSPTSVTVPLLGNANGLYTRAHGNRVRNTTTTQPDISVTCGAYALSGAAAMDIGVPYVPPLPGCGLFTPCTQMSPIGFHLESAEQEAISRPGLPVAFRGDIANGYISISGVRAIQLDPAWPANLGIRVPSNQALPAIAQVMANEQVTTTGAGVPTRRRRAYDPTAMSGYTNGLHVTLLGSTVGDLTMLHAATLINELYLPAPICNYPAHRCAKFKRT
jgi:hypothetical protein